MNSISVIVCQREVRAHFGCPSLEGGELEDQGINGTALTHWEKRVFEVLIHSPHHCSRPSVRLLTNVCVSQNTKSESPRAFSYEF